MLNSETVDMLKVIYASLNNLPNFMLLTSASETYIVFKLVPSMCIHAALPSPTNSNR